ncbi:hypothetical protein MUK51_10945 [Sphingobacterium faecium]|uniref:hypothetical protein n=1 Tax=Sphingobacterium faecium TaxID=34087 RepID=UPI0021B4F414|nr:hypothetical protein [Sphingobacterium faecium]UXD67744.1 hypothetical protein MUK51_10945 [Sphingobacterium faecium]
MLKKAIFLGILQTVLVFLLTKFVEGVEDGKFPLFETILNAKAVSFLNNHDFTILVILILLNILVYLYTNIDKFYSNKQEIYDNICEAIFNSTIKNNSELRDSDFRVSLFKLKSRLLFDKKYYQGYIPTIQDFLVNVGRHQTRQKKTLSKIKFLPNEGAVGKCYNIGELYFAETCKNTSTKYSDEQNKKTNIPHYKIEKLQEKSTKFVAVPVRHHNSQEIFGVIVVDSLDNNFDVKEFRAIEDLVNYCGIFFKK